MNDGITFLFVSKELYFDFVIFLFFFSLFLQKIHTMPFEVGNNIVGLIPGKHYNTSNDRIVLIGAHWDTFGVSPGLNDNGSGVASLLEVPTNVLLTATYYGHFWFQKKRPFCKKCKIFSLFSIKILMLWTYRNLPILY